MYMINSPLLMNQLMKSIFLAIFFLVNPGGKIKSGLISYYCNFFSPGDDFETLLDGSVVWSIVDDEDNLYLGILPVKDTQTLLDRFPKEIIPCSKLDDFLSMRGEEAEKGVFHRPPCRGGCRIS